MVVGVGGGLDDTARRCKVLGGGGFPPSMLRHMHIPHLLEVGGMVVRAVTHIHPGCIPRA